MSLYFTCAHAHTHTHTLYIYIYLCIYIYTCIYIITHIYKVNITQPNICVYIFVIFIYIYICTHPNICIYIYIYKYTYFIFTHPNAHTHIYIYLYIYIFIYIYIFAYIYILCKYICWFLQIHAETVLPWAVVASRGIPLCCITSGHGSLLGSSLTWSHALPILEHREWANIGGFVLLYLDQ